MADSVINIAQTPVRHRRPGSHNVGGAEMSWMDGACLRSARCGAGLELLIDRREKRARNLEKCQHAQQNANVKADEHEDTQRECEGRNHGLLIGLWLRHVHHSLVTGSRLVLVYSPERVYWRFSAADRLCRPVRVWRHSWPSCGGLREANGRRRHSP
jgi:hypothetical protein